MHGSKLTVFSFAHIGIPAAHKVDTETHRKEDTEPQRGKVRKRQYTLTRESTRQQEVASDADCAAMRVERLSRQLVSHNACKGRGKERSRGKEGARTGGA